MIANRYKRCNVWGDHWNQLNICMTCVVDQWISVFFLGSSLLSGGCLVWWWPRVGGRQRDLWGRTLVTLLHFAFASVKQSNTCLKPFPVHFVAFWHISMMLDWNDWMTVRLQFGDHCAWLPVPALETISQWFHGFSWANKNSYCLGENITWLQDVVFCLWLSWFCVILLALYENPSNNNNSDFMEWAQLDPELVFFRWVCWRMLMSRQGAPGEASWLKIFGAFR